MSTGGASPGTPPAYAFTAEPAPASTGAVPSADAHAPPSAGIRLALRLGWALPLGDVEFTDSLGDTYRSLVPVGVEAGYRFSPRVSLSAYVEYGLGAVQQSLCGQVDCSAHSVRWEALLAYRLARNSADASSFSVHLVPWAALGIGYETTRISIARGDQQASRTNRGPYADAQLGIDLMVHPRVGLGALATFAVGEFFSANVDTPAGSNSYDIVYRRLHAWPMVGLRAVYDF